LNALADEYIGNNGAAIFNQSGSGSVHNAAYLILGFGATGVGDYNLNDGSLTVGSIDIYGSLSNDVSSFNQGGGSVTV